MDAFAWGAAAGGVVAVVLVIVTVSFFYRRREAARPLAASARPAVVFGGQGVQVGPNSVQVNNYTQPSPVTSTPDAVVVGDVPQRAPAFQPRSEVVALLADSGPGVTVVRAMTGMRGVGKTQIAASYARRQIDAGWRLVAWVNAADSTQVLSGLADIAEALDVGEPGADLESIGGSVRHRLEVAGHQCLVVFDNAGNLDHLARFLPSAGQCQVIITSNQREAEVFGAVISVDVFTEQEALLFLAQRTGQSDQAAARELAAELGFLPLALAHAAAVIVAQHLNYLTFLDRLRTAPVRDFLKRSTAEPYPRGVDATILLALNAVTDQGQEDLYQGLIDVIALLATEGIPRTLLYAAGRQGLLSPPGTDAVVRPESIDEALGRLASSSLLTFSMDDTTVAMHRLTGRVAVERQAQGNGLKDLGAGIAAMLVTETESLAEPWQSRSLARNTIQQIMALQAHLAPNLRDHDTELIDTLLYLRAWAIWCLNHLGDSFAQAIEYGQELVADSERILGKTHPDSLGFRNNLAGAYRAAGRLDEAITLFERTLADQQQVMGGSHPSALASGNNLAGAYQAAGRLDDAIVLFERTLTDSERVLGNAHPDTLSFRNNLAGAYRAAGRLDEAIVLFERTLTDSERVLGGTHPWALSFRNNLAGAYRAAGRLDEAIVLFESTRMDCERVMGETHPDALGLRNNLALACQAAGRLDEAIALFERTLADRQQVLGETHPDALRSRENLAQAYEAAGRMTEAEGLRARTRLESG